MPNRSLPALIVLLLAFSNVAQAAALVPVSRPAIDPATCDQLAGNPSAPMSVEACKTMMRMGEDDPSTHRPGDESMSCEQIFAELQTMEGEGISDATATQTDALNEEARVLGAQHEAEMARQMLPSPLAIASSLLPNAVGAALMAPEFARRGAAMTKLKANNERFNAKLNQHSTTSSVELSDLMDTNPRLPRLVQLAMQKECQPPIDP